MDGFYNVRDDGVQKVADATQRLVLIPPDGWLVEQLDDNTLWAWNEASATWIPFAGSGGVTDVNGLVGSVNLVAGTGISITPSGNDLIFDATGGGVTGSGTATRIAYWSGTSSLTSDAELFFDPTNNFLGVGVASPLYIGDFAANGLSGGDPFNPDATVALHNIGDGSNFLETGLAFFSALNGNPDYYNARIYSKQDSTSVTDARITIQTVNGSFNLVDVLSVKNDRVGIGINTPQFELDVVGTASGVGVINVGNIAFGSVGQYNLQERFFATQNTTTGFLKVGFDTGGGGFGDTSIGISAGNGNAIQNTCIGNSAGTAITSGVNNCFVGYAAGIGVTSGAQNTIIGAAAGTVTTGSSNVLIGTGNGTALTNTTNSIAIGVGVVAGSSQFVIGSASNPITDYVFGTSNSAATPNSVTFRPTPAAGLDRPGGRFIINGGISTGSQGGGAIIFGTSPAGSSSSTPNSTVNRNSITSDGNFNFHDPASANAIGFISPSLAGSYNLVWPNAQATLPTDVLTNDGAGNLSWATPTGTGANTELSNLSAGAVAINTDLNPDTDLTYGIGNGSFRWDSIHLRHINLYGSTSGVFIMDAADTVTDYTIIWPDSQGAVDTVPTNDGTGKLTWVVPPSTAVIELFDFSSDAGNVAITGETDLYSATIAAGQLSIANDKLVAHYAGIFSGAASSTQQIRIYFAGVEIFDTGALSIGALSPSWDAEVLIIRGVGDDTRITVSFTSGSTLLSANSIYTEIGAGGVDFDSTNILVITGEAAGIAAADNQIIAKLGNIEFRIAA